MVLQSTSRSGINSWFLPEIFPSSTSRIASKPRRKESSAGWSADPLTEALSAEGNSGVPLGSELPFKTSWSKVQPDPSQPEGGVGFLRHCRRVPLLDSKEAMTGESLLGFDREARIDAPVKAEGSPERVPNLTPLTVASVASELKLSLLSCWKIYQEIKELDIWKAKSNTFIVDQHTDCSIIKGHLKKDT